MISLHRRVYSARVLTRGGKLREMSRIHGCTDLGPGSRAKSRIAAQLRIYFNLHEILPVEGTVSGNRRGDLLREGADSPAFTLLDVGRVTRESLRELYRTEFQSKCVLECNYTNRAKQAEYNRRGLQVLLRRI